MSYLQPLACSLARCQVPWAVCHLPWPPGTQEQHQPTVPGPPVSVSVSPGALALFLFWEVSFTKFGFLCFVFFSQEAAWPLVQQVSLPVQHQMQVASLQATHRPGLPLLGLQGLRDLPARTSHLQVRRCRKSLVYVIDCLNNCNNNVATDLDFSTLSLPK